MANKPAIVNFADAKRRTFGHGKAFKATTARIGVELGAEQIGCALVELEPGKRAWPYHLHYADAALNKLLALAGRQEIRDFVDILHLHDSYLHLGAMAWAACGKDPGFSPGFLLDQAGRHVAYTQADMDRLNLREPLDLKSLKKRWLGALEEAQQLVDALPPDEVGCLYLDAEQSPVTPNPASGFSALRRHHGSIRGAWPTVG